ncbi:hypothetical protein [Paraburkholderia caballeronis]|uniref:Uncharacterized protein n=1 Tax=Paraburkholderia caballeronis TaxID=416943 RepID=A0A1H7L7Q9_9BURK|nr:hypothetical protein [Paraburkholderia caballeronis]PXW28330.1 hypothetical protein C7403_102222 [Paraburkholderia caballeronis]PXX03696.1 hypothetical protein C7407_102222 [Paraburkholderia caballeronis]RAK04440.1 hypothetical protein C7409_102222 [Paraburkholderia caballeronis]SED80100.1 hypothetical protein SAMN05445871_3953 [Paraburkholderia caballeronis]SEK94978.1 hypothetical protein SAMN05192542_104222 [Paraburkholderia caballeronis]
MTQRTPTPKAAPAALDPEAEEALRVAVGAAAMLGREKVQALLELPDAELGHLFKYGIMQLANLFTSVTFEGYELSRQTKEATRTRKDRRADEGAFEFASPSDGRQALVSERKLLLATEVCRGLGITRQVLGKALAAGRIFTVDVGARRYYPAFYVHGDFDRTALERVTQLLGSLPGWSKWQFFTTPKASLGKLTPLQALSRGKLALVERAAKAFAE